MADSEEIVQQDFSAFCRVCLQMPDESQVLDVTTIYDEDEQLTYAECFRICTKIDLSAGVGVPHNLCKSCGLELQMTYDFYKKVEDSKRFLRHLVEEQERLAHQQSEVLETEDTESLRQTETLTVNKLVDHNEDVEQLESHKVLEEEEQDDEERVSSQDQCELDTGVEQLDCVVECEGLEEHLDMEEYQVVEELEDEDAETIHIKCGGEAYIIQPMNLIDGANDADDVDDVDDADVNGDDDYGDDEAEEQQEEMSWQEAVVAVANEEHLPLETDTQSHTKNTTESKEESRILSSRNNDSGRKRYIGKYSCDFCHKIFPNHSRMVMHRRAHEPDRPKYTCESCGRMYATKQAMDVHVRTVHIKTGYTCPICNKIYAIKKGLEVHMRYHTGDFPYICDLCGKKFAQMCHLNTHKNVKHNSVRFSCEHPNCGKFFTSSASLRNHEFSHGIMPFECEFCQRGYPAKSKLKVHIKRKHGKDMTLEQLEHMRKFHVMRSKLSLVKVVECED